MLESLWSYNMKLDWCKKQNKGIELIEPNKDLANEYFNSAQETLKVLLAVKNTGSKMWLATTKYYFEYHGFYSFLQRIGVKCEIHDCTIELANFLEEKGFISEIYEVLKTDKELYIDNQYYLKNKPVNIDDEKLREYLYNIQRLLDNITNKQIIEIRELLK